MRTKWWVNSLLNEPVVSLKEPGAADHSSVDQDALFEPILSNFGTESCWLYTFSYSVIQIFNV